MPSQDTQDRLEIFQGPLEKGIVDWVTFHNLEQDQRAEAERILQEEGCTSPDPTNNYEIIVGRAGIHEGSPVPQIDNKPAYITTRENAQSLADYLTSKKLTVRIEHN